MLGGQDRQKQPRSRHNSQRQGDADRSVNRPLDPAFDAVQRFWLCPHHPRLPFSGSGFERKGCLIPLSQLNRRKRRKNLGSPGALICATATLLRRKPRSVVNDDLFGAFLHAPGDHGRNAQTFRTSTTRWACSAATYRQSRRPCSGAIGLVVIQLAFLRMKASTGVLSGTAVMR